MTDDTDPETERHDVLNDGFAAVDARTAAARDADDPLVVHGVAVGENDVSTGLSEIPTRWPPAVLRSMEGMLEGKPITLPESDDPNQHVGVERTDDGVVAQPHVPLDAKVGEVVDDRYESGVGLVFEAHINHPEAEDFVERGVAQVSPVMAREVAPDPESDDPDQMVAVEVHAVRDLGMVSMGGIPSNDIQPGSLAAMSAMTAEALSGMFTTPADDGGADGSSDGDLEAGAADIIPGDAEALALSEARTPSYDGTASAGDREWPGGGPSLSDFVAGYAENADTDEDAGSLGDEWATIPQDAREWVAQLTLIGDPDADTMENGIAYPVVFPDTNALSEDALRSALNLAHHAGPAEDSVRSTAQDLLDDEFGDGGGDGDTDEGDADGDGGDGDDANAGGDASSVFPTEAGGLRGALAKRLQDRRASDRKTIKDGAHSVAVDSDLSRRVLRGERRRGEPVDPDDDAVARQALGVDDDETAADRAPVDVEDDPVAQAVLGVGDTDDGDDGDADPDPVDLEDDSVARQALGVDDGDGDEDGPEPEPVDLEDDAVARQALGADGDGGDGGGGS